MKVVYRMGIPELAEIAFTKSERITISDAAALLMELRERIGDEDSEQTTDIALAHYTLKALLEAPVEVAAMRER